MTRPANVARARLDGRPRAGTGRAAAAARLTLDDGVALAEPAPVVKPHGGQPIRFPPYYQRRQPIQYVRLHLDAQRLELWTSTPQVEVSTVAVAGGEAALVWGIGRPRVAATRHGARVQALVDIGALSADDAALLAARDKREFITKLLDL